MIIHCSLEYTNSCTLKMEAVDSSETTILICFTRLGAPDDGYPNLRYGSWGLYGCGCWV